MRNAAKTALLGVAVLVCAVVALKGSVLQVASGMWAPTANLAQPSAGASAALLQDGRILITGGDAGNGALVSADLFNMDGSVSPAAPMNGARSKHVSVTLQDGRVLVAGGTVLGGGATNAAEIYDPIANTWTSLAGGMIEARSGATAALLQDGRAAIAGGQNGNVASSTIEIFDPVAGSFSFAGTLSSPRELHAMAVLADGRVIIIGGSNGTIPVASTDILDPVAGSVAVGPSLATPRSGHSATTLLDGRVLVAGGNHIVTNADGTTTPTDLASAEIFDPSTDTFSVVASALTTARQGHQAFLLPHNGNVLIVGGTFSGTATASAELYTPWTGAISATSPMSTARSQATGGALSNGNPTSQNDGLLLVAGGTDASSPAKTLAGTELYGFATVKTDQSDYAPGTTVTITGTGWKPGETVTLSFLESPLIDTHPTLTAMADANGNITNNQFSPDIHDVNVRFYLTATGSASQAQTTFTDAPDKVGTVSVSAQLGTLAYGTPGSATYTVTVTRGNNGAFTANLNITGLPAGTSFSFSPASLSFPTNSDTSHASTLTVTTTAAAQPGATTFTVTAANSGNSTDNVSNTGTLTIGKATVTPHITANNKTYDGTTTATLSSQALTGVVGTDLVNLVVGAANFDTKNVGTGKTVTATGLTLSGANAGNYVLSSPSATTTANITTRTLHVTATADNKIYDGTVTEPNTSIHLSDDRVSGDILTVSFTSAAFADKNVGNGKTVTVSGLSISSGSDAGNYTLNSVTQVTTTANITARTLHVTATADNKIYDGAATEPNTSIHLSDDRITGDVLTVGFASAAFPDKNVGTAKVVTVSGLSITGGADAANYTLNSITQITTAANITALHLTGSFTASSKTYDGTNSATALTRSLNGAISGDIVSLTGGTATFSDKTVANGKTVTLVGATLSGTDAGNYILDSVATTTANITALHITGSFTASSKTYDGTNSATVLTRSLNGAISGDIVSLTGGTATFSDKTVANGKTVTLVGATLSGTDAGNYILDSVAATTANIMALHITGSFTASSKTYDGTNSATVLTRSLIGAISGDMVSLTGGTASFADKTVANSKTVTLTGASLTGTDAGNYILDSVATTTANIMALHITGSFTAGSKIYDGNASATVLTRSLIGAISGDMVSLTGGTASFADKTVANSKTVTLTGASLTGTDAGNYILDSVATTTANITALHITGSFTASSKTYDGTNSATVLTRSLIGAISGDMVSLTGGTASFSDKTVANGKTVTLTGTSLTGTDAGNYILDSVATTTANIMALHITGSFTAGSKIYDGNASATVLTRSLIGAISGDIVSLTGGTASFADKTVANGKTVTLTGASLTGTDAGNYILDSVATTTANITALHITGSFTAGSKTYDGTNSATALTRSLNGAISGDMVSLTGGTASFSDKTVANGKTVTLTGASLTGTDAGNYILDSVATTTANIMALHITGSFTAGSKIYDGNASATVLTRSLIGAISGDMVSLTGGTASFADKTVANGKTVTLTGTSLTGTDAGNYILDSVAATTANIMALHITGSFTAGSKIYDGNASATVLTRSLIGAISGDMVSLTGGTASFADKTVANGKTVTLTGASLTGADAGNYALDSVGTTTANITALHITGSFTAGSKTYDGNASATVLTETPNGIISPDMVTLAGGTASFSDKTVANGKTVTLTGASLTGTDAGNYILDSVATTTANITALHITGSFTAGSKIYDGNASATVLTRSLIGAISGDIVSLTGGTASFSDKTVANGKTVTLTGASLTGTDAGNYILDSVATTTANITALHITGSFTAGSKTYDGNASATVLTETPNGIISPDMVTLAGGTASFSDKTVANGKTVALTGASLTGADASNYILDSVATTMANITALHITGSFTASSKIYDGNASATVLTRSLIGAISADVVSLTGGTATFADKNVGMGKVVTLTGASLSGADAGDYILDSVGTTTANITPAPLTATVTADAKQYDGNTMATLHCTLPTGVFSGDMVNCSATGAFASKDVATPQTVNLTNIILGGAQAGDYSLSATTGTTSANITPIALTAAVTADAKQYDGNTTAALHCTLPSGVLSGDMVNCSATGAFASKNVATPQTVNLTNIILGGAQAGDYSLTATTGTTSANITPITVTAAVTADAKQYDGNTTATLHCSLPSGVLSGDMVNCSATGAFASKNVATPQTVNTTNIILGGAQAGDYSLTTTTGTTSANITSVPVTATLTAANKTYDGTATEPNANMNCLLTGVLSGDSTNVSCMASSGTFDGPNVGVHTVTALVTIMGTAAGNYTLGAAGTALSSVNATASANIAPAATSTSVSSSANPSALSQVVTFTAVVKNTQTSPTPTGSVQFIIDGSNSGGPVVLSGGTASVSTSTLSVGPHSVVAMYTNSDGNFVGSTSSTLTQQVNYGFLGFGAPYAPPPTTFNVTRTMPLKWQYTNSSGAVVNSAAANPVVIINGPYPCGGSDTAGTITVNDAGASGYQYDPGSNSWQFNWQIKGSVVGCYDIYVKSQQSGQTTGPSPISVVNK